MGRGLKRSLDERDESLSKHDQELSDLIYDFTPIADALIEEYPTLSEENLKVLEESIKHPSGGVVTVLLSSPRKEFNKTHADSFIHSEVLEPYLIQWLEERYSQMEEKATKINQSKFDCAIGQLMRNQLQHLIPEKYYQKWLETFPHAPAQAAMAENNVESSAKLPPEVFRAVMESKRAIEERNIQQAEQQSGSRRHQRVEEESDSEESASEESISDDDSEHASSNSTSFIYQALNSTTQAPLPSTERSAKRQRTEKNNEPSTESERTERVETMPAGHGEPFIPADTPLTITGGPKLA